MLTVLGISLSLNVWLGSRLRALTTVQARGGLKIGTSLPSIPVRSLDGTKATLTFNQPTMVYVLSPGCVWCELNHASILALASATRHDYAWVGLSLHPDSAAVKAYLTRWPLPFDVLLPETDVLGRLSINATPTTIVVDAGGQIRQAWVGAFTGDRLESARAFFGRWLPNASRDLPE
jgi:hypothetical protein